MKYLTLKSLVLSTALGLAATPAVAKDFYKMSTLGPGSSPNLVMTTFANIVNQNQDALEIQVNATGAATKHALEVARGKVDLFMSSPSLHHLMASGKAMYKKIEDAPKLAKNIRSIFNFPIGLYHIVVNSLYIKLV